MHLRQLLKETILLLIATNVIYLLLPRWLKRTLKLVTRLVSMCFKEVTQYAEKAFRDYYKQNKKAIPKSKEQPLSNVITITYPSGKIKEYRKAK